MAKQDAVPMVDKRQSAVLTGDDLSTRAAHNKGRIAAAVEHDDRLLAAREGLCEESAQRLRNDRAPPAPQFLAHIDGTHARQRLPSDALRHRE